MGIKIIIAALLWGFLPNLWAQGLPANAPLEGQTQFFLEDEIYEGHPAKIYVVGERRTHSEVTNILYQTVDLAREVWLKLQADLPQSELKWLNEKSAKGTHTVSRALAFAIKEGLEVSRWTLGAFDVTFPSPRSGFTTKNFTKVSVNLDRRQVRFKSSGLRLDLSFLDDGFLIDIMAAELEAKGYSNFYIEFHGCHLARGRDVGRPWKIPVEDFSDKKAKRAFYFKVKNVASATFYPTGGEPPLIDPVTKEPVQSDLKQVTVFTKRAALAQGYATALYTMGLKEAKKFLSRATHLRAILIDQNGKFYKIPPFPNE